MLPRRRWRQPARLLDSSQCGWFPPSLSGIPAAPWRSVESWVLIRTKAPGPPDLQSVCGGARAHQILASFLHRNSFPRGGSPVHGNVTWGESGPASPQRMKAFESLRINPPGSTALSPSIYSSTFIFTRAKTGKKAGLLGSQQEICS